jgi:regulator of replication initiation timing
VNNSVEIFEKMAEMIESGNAASIQVSVNMELANDKIEQLESENKKLRAANEVLRQGLSDVYGHSQTCDTCNATGIAEEALESADKILNETK